VGLGLDMGQAFELLRGQARNRRLAELAGAPWPAARSM
jgi:hypothetical protein